MMTDQQLLNGIRAGLALLVVIPIIGLFSAGSVYEAFCLVALSATCAGGLYSLRGF